MAKKSKPPLVVSTVHVEGVTYQQRFTMCGKDRCKKGCRQGRPSHGPYWYAFVWNAKTATTRALYVGKELPRLETLADRPEMK